MEDKKLLCKADYDSAKAKGEERRKYFLEYWKKEENCAYLRLNTDNKQEGWGKQ